MEKTKRISVVLELRTSKRQMILQIMESLMTRTVNAIKKEFRALYSRGSPPSPGHKERVLLGNNVCKLIFCDIYGFNILLMCDHTFITI